MKRRKDTMRKFIITCIDLLVQAQKEGGTMEDLYQISKKAKMPKGEFSTFCLYFWQIRKMTPKQRKAELRPKFEMVADAA